MIGNLNFTSLSLQNVSLKNKADTNQNKAEATSTPSAAGNNTYPLMDARNVLMPSVSFKGVSATTTQLTRDMRNNCHYWSKGNAPKTNWPLSINTKKFNEEFENSPKIKGDLEDLGSNGKYYRYTAILFKGTSEETNITYLGAKKGSKIYKLEKVQRGKLVNTFKGVNYGKDWTQDKIYDLNLQYANSATGFCRDAGGNDSAIKALKFEVPQNRSMRYELKIQGGNGIHTRWLCEDPRTNPNGEVVFNWATWNGNWHTNNSDYSRPLLPNTIPQIY